MSLAATTMRWGIALRVGGEDPPKMREPGEISATCHHWSPRTQPLTSPCSLLRHHQNTRLSSFPEIVAGACRQGVLGFRPTTKRPARRYLKSLRNHGSRSTRPYIKPSISKGSPRTPLQRGVEGSWRNSLTRTLSFCILRLPPSGGGKRWTIQ